VSSLAYQNPRHVHFPSEKNSARQAKNVFRSVAVASTVAITTILPSSAFAVSIENGQILFNQNCASCHRDGANVMNPKRDMKKETLLKYFGSNGSDTLDPNQIVDWVEKSGQHKRLIFPQVSGGKLSNEDYQSVISYIVDQASNDKW
jgi:cytochrome c6